MDFCNDLDPEELEGTLSFDTVETANILVYTLRMCLTNLFQHQIHHRGQTHHMLSHAGLEPPPLDVVQFGSDFNYCEKTKTDVIVIGAGQAGLATSYYLTKAKIEHIILERGSIANAWKNERGIRFA